RDRGHPPAPCKESSPHLLVHLLKRGCKPSAKAPRDSHASWRGLARRLDRAFPPAAPLAKNPLGLLPVFPLEHVCCDRVPFAREIPPNSFDIGSGRLLHDLVKALFANTLEGFRIGADHMTIEKAASDLDPCERPLRERAELLQRVHRHGPRNAEQADALGRGDASHLAP